LSLSLLLFLAIVVARCCLSIVYLVAHIKSSVV
jgi:hypothetical protein